MSKRSSPPPTIADEALGNVSHLASDIADLAQLTNTVLRQIANNVIDPRHVANVAPGVALIASDINRRACALLDLLEVLKQSEQLEAKKGGGR